MATTKKATRRDAGRARGAPITEAVLNATLEELATSGLEALSMERVARRAEVNKTTLYRRWPTREALVAAALAGIRDDVATNAPDTGSLRGDLLGLVAPVVELARKPAGLAVIRASFAESSSRSIASVAAHKVPGPATAPLRGLVARARARGEFRGTARDAEQLVFALVGAILHRAVMEQAPLSPRWLQSLVDLVLLGAIPR